MTTKTIEVRVPDDFPELPHEFAPYLSRIEAGEVFSLALERSQHELAEQKSRHRYRNGIAIWLIVLCSAVVAVSLALIIAKSIGYSQLPDNSVHTLIASVAVQIVAMTFVVVRFFFARD